MELKIGKKLTNLTCKRQEMSISKEADHGFYESNPSLDQEIYSIKLNKVGLSPYHHKRCIIENS